MTAHHHFTTAIVSAAAVALAFSAGSASAQVELREVDLTNHKIEIVNTSGGTLDISNWWLCNRVNGSPFYQQFNAGATVDGSLSSAGASLTSFGAGQTLVLDITDTQLPDTLGEFGIYNTNSFTSPSAIVDYVLWNNSGIRDTPANGAGLWPLNEDIDTTGILAGETLQALPGTSGNGPTEWTIGAGTLGATNIPEPTSLGLLALGGLACMRRRR